MVGATSFTKALGIKNGELLTRTICSHSISSIVI